jgi:hypothetical protein
VPGDAARTPGASRRTPSISASARPRLRVDRAPLPGHAADHWLRAVQPAHLRGGERAHHVAAAADPKHKRAARTREQQIGVDHARSSHAI